MKQEYISLIGGSGFVGGTLLHRLLESQESAQIKVATRNIGSRNFQTVLNGVVNQGRVSPVEADHLDATRLRLAVEKAKTIYDTAGLAWQHPGERGLSKHDLLVEEIVQNAISAYVLANVTRPDQVVVWTSTNAIDYMLARLSDENLEKLQSEVQEITNSITSSIDLERNTVQEFYTIVHSILRKNSPGYYPKFTGSLEKVRFALDFSYAYSKYLGQTILERLSHDNIRVLKISDVYGPGQDVSERMIDPKLPARRLQRFMTAYRLIRDGMTDWIPSNGANLHGFSQKNGKITQEVWNDSVFPTHVDDVCKLMVQAGQYDGSQTLFEVSGKKVKNLRMAETVRDVFGVDVDIKVQDVPTLDVPEASQDLTQLGMSKKGLISLRDGVARWVSTLSLTPPSNRQKHSH